MKVCCHYINLQLKIYYIDTDSNIKICFKCRTFKFKFTINKNARIRV